MKSEFPSGTESTEKTEVAVKGKSVKFSGILDWKNVETDIKIVGNV